MSFCLRPNVCKKCGKPLTLFEGWTCLECEKLEQESTVDVLEQIRDEIEQSFDGYLVVDKDKDYASNTFKGQPAITINHVFEIIDKYRGGGSD